VLLSLCMPALRVSLPQGRAPLPPYILVKLLPHCSPTAQVWAGPRFRERCRYPYPASLRGHGQYASPHPRLPSTPGPAVHHPRVFGGAHRVRGAPGAGPGLQRPAAEFLDGPGADHCRLRGPRGGEGGAQYPAHLGGPHPHCGRQLWADALQRQRPLLRGAAGEAADRCCECTCRKGPWDLVTVLV
jgi:hypothetical protein